MSLKSVARTSPCRNVLGVQGPTISRCISASSRLWLNQTTWRGKVPSTATAGTRKRSSKTKVVVKASDLHQGTLPQLPPDPADNGPAKTYPTVLQQHLNNMHKFPDCIVLTRIGDFYELYFEQVNQYAHLLNLKAAKRSTSLGDVAMAGFQYTQLERYLKIIVQDLGKKVAISEQIAIPEHERVARGGGMLYDRKVTRVVTAGTLIDENFMDPYENSYLLGVHFDGPPPSTASKTGDNEAYDRYKRTMKVGLSWVDLSSGDFNTATGDLASLPSLVARIGPREVVLDSKMEGLDGQQIQQYLGEGSYSLQFHTKKQIVSSVAEWTPMLERAVPQQQLPNFCSNEVQAGNLVLDYVRDKLREMKVQLQPPVRRSGEEYMAIDKQSLRGLEVKSTLRDGVLKGSLLHTVRRTVTKSGARLLGQRLVSPSMTLSVINNRLDLVQEMLGHNALCEDVIALLRQTSDTLRLLQRFSIGRGDADDLLGLAKTIDVMQQMSCVLHEHIIGNQDGSDDAASESGCLWDILDRFDLEGPAKVAKAILTAIDEEGLTRQHTADLEIREDAEGMTDEVVSADAAGEVGPRLARRASKGRPTPLERSDTGTEDIWIMRRNASSALERAHNDLGKLLESKQDLAMRLRKTLKADSLTLQWSSQGGHYCHLKGRDAQLDVSALDGARVIKATKTTRWVALREWEELGFRIDSAKLRIRREEERVFDTLRGRVIENLMKLRRNAVILDELDVACSSATIARERGLIRPKLNNSTSHKIIGGRHPTVDVGLREQGRFFTSNDCTVGDQEKIYLITGPNMAGKSTYLRQNALITILAQTGCFVPAEYAEIGLVDKIFSRVGSADNLYQDQSTFMVEMMETAEILTQATPRSFVIMDEVGRGTTPEDGIAVGHACIHHLHNVNRCRTLFATHFHVLTDMTQDFKDVACYCTDVTEEVDGSWMYDHRLRPGVNRQSHALKVARLAGIPQGAIEVAAEVLEGMQKP